MNAILIINVSFTLFFVTYLLVFKKLTHFQWNRFYLLGALLFSCILPWLDLPVIERAIVGMPVVELPTILVSPQSEPTLVPVIEIASWVYWIGVIIGAMIFMRALWNISKRVRGGEKNASTDYLVSEGAHAYSFFNRIDIGRSIEHDLKDMILSHERVHRDQMHSIDVVLFAIARILGWFNPFVHMAAKEVQINHEYLADQKVYDDFGTDYQYSLLNQAMDTKAFKLTNTFYSKSIIKNRIIMMNKSKSGKRSVAVYALVIPITAMALWISACSNEPGVPDAQKKGAIDEVMKPSADNVYSKQDDLDAMPSFPGGNEGMMTFFNENFKYPEALKQADVTGRAVISFVVQEDGTLRDFEAVESDDERLEKPAIAFLKTMPEWVPGKKNDQNVKVKMVLPIQYTMN